jgi:hypothetical protein
MMPRQTFTESENTLVTNNISTFKATWADVLLQGDNNLLVGVSGRMIDNGKDNKALD